MSVQEDIECIFKEATDNHGQEFHQEVVRLTMGLLLIMLVMCPGDSRHIWTKVLAHS
jgi:hypothetical protein